MDGWWDEVEAGISEAAAASLLGVLAGAGVVRITRIGAGERSVAFQTLEKYSEPRR